MKKSLLLLIAFIALFFSCSDDLETSSGTKDSADGKTYLVIGGASLGRTILSPQEASVETLKKISLKGTIAGGDEETLVSEQESYGNFIEKTKNPIEIEAGTWAFILSAELEGIAFSCKKEDVSIEAGKENKVTFELVAVNDASGLSITLNFPMDKNIERVETVLKKADGTTIESKNFTDSDGDFKITEIPNGNETEKVYSITYSRDIDDDETNLESGTYHITFNFYATGISEPINSPDYYVRVAKGFTTTSEQNISLNETYSIAYVENGGVLVDGETQTMKYFRKSEVELPEMEKSGYVFVGWYEDKDFTKPIERIAKESTGNKTLYAAFINSITVSANGTADANVLKGDSMESINSAVKRIVEFDTPIDWTIFVDGKLEEAQEIGQELKPSNAKSLTIEGVHENTIPDDSAPTGTDGYTDIIVYKALSPEIETINNTASAFYISTSAPVIIKNIEITGAGESGMGGGICMATHLVNVTLESGTWITGNVAGMYGGGVAVNGTLTMKDGAVICDNYCDWRGGGVFIGNPGAKFYMEGGIIRDNSADEGSGVYVSNTGSLTMSGTAYINSNNDVGLEVIDAGVLVGDLSENTHEIVATVTPAGYEVGYSVLDPAEGVTLTKESINKFAIVQPTSSEYDWIIGLDGKLTKRTASGTGSVTTDNRALNIAINTNTLYRNTAVRFSATDAAGNKVSDGVTYSAEILYKGREVNTLGGETYYSVSGNVLTLSSTNPLPKEGAYQLYVTASQVLNGSDKTPVTSSQTFDVEFVNEIVTPDTQVALYDYDSDNDNCYSYYLVDSSDVQTAELKNPVLATSTIMPTFDMYGNFYCLDSDAILKSNNPNIGTSGVQLAELQSMTDYTHNFIIDLANNNAYAWGGKYTNYFYLYKYPSLLTSGDISDVEPIKITTTNFSLSKVVVYDNILYAVGTDRNADYDTKIRTYDLSVIDSETTEITEASSEYNLSTYLGTLNFANWDISDVYALEGALYLLIKDCSYTSKSEVWNSAGDNIYNRGALVKYVAPINEQTEYIDYRGLKETVAFANTDITKMQLYYGGTGPLYSKGSYDSPILTIDGSENVSSSSTTKFNYYFPNVYGISGTNIAEKCFASPAKVIAIKPKKLVIADDGIAFYTDSDGFAYMNINRVVTINLEDFVIESVQTTKANFDSNITGYLRSDSAVSLGNIASANGSYYSDDVLGYYYNGSAASFEGYPVNNLGGVVFAIKNGDKN